MDKVVESSLRKFDRVSRRPIDGLAMIVDQMECSPIVKG